MSRPGRPAALEQAREVVALEAREARPQPDVHRRRVLRLQAAHALEHARRCEVAALEQQLAGEQRPVEVALAEDALRHRGQR